MKLSINRVRRIIIDLDEYMHGDYPKKAREDIDEKYKKLEKIEKRIKLYTLIRAICYILLYVSVFYAVFGNVVIIGDLLGVITRISGVISSALLVLVIVMFNKIVNIAVSDAHTIASYIIAVSVKHQK